MLLLLRSWKKRSNYLISEHVEYVLLWTVEVGKPKATQSLNCWVLKLHLVIFYAISEANNTKFYCVHSGLNDLLICIYNNFILCNKASTISRRFSFNKTSHSYRIRFICWFSFFCQVGFNNEKASSATVCNSRLFISCCFFTYVSVYHGSSYPFIPRPSPSYFFTFSRWF